MPNYAAFLRAINVGGHTVKMETLRGLFEALGFSNVETFIASGNVVFDSGHSSDPKALERQIEDSLKAALGYSVATFIRTLPGLAELARYQPFPASSLAAEGSGVYIAFVASSLSPQAEQKLLAFNSQADVFHVHGCEIYWLRQGRFSESEFSGALLEKTIGMPATVRNSTTILKMVSKYEPPKKNALGGPMH
jgi:uncharacterized protein (DUF1697 family)